MTPHQQRTPNQTKGSFFLDEETVATLELEDGKTDRIVFDRVLKGFGIRLRIDGGCLHRTWIAQYRVGNRTRRQKIGDVEKLKASEARNQARKELAKVILGRDPQSEKEAQRSKVARTLRSVADDYLAMRKLDVDHGEYRAASYRVTKLYLTGNAYFGPLHTKTITEISLADIAARLNLIIRNSGHVTAGRARSALSSLFTWAMRQGFMGANPHNPVIGTKNPDPAKSRDHVLDDRELAAIWRACRDDDFGKIIRLLILTACRRGEIGGLRWSELGEDRTTLTLPKARVKNKHEHSLPLTTLALAIIEAIPERAGRDNLFGDRSDVGFTRWDAGKDDLDERLSGKVAGWRVHDLRRSVATWMAEHGNIEPHIIEAVLNHYSGHRSGVAGTYNRARYKNQIRAALTLWDEHLQSIVGDHERRVVPFQGAA